jgi:serine phosphatase RsbU (regulator of sigma subunit)
VRAIQNISAKAELVGKGNLNVSFEYQSKDELGKLTASLNSMVQDLREREMMRRELTAAEEIQKRLLPAVMPDNMNGFVSFGTFYKAMSGVGGDYYDFIKTGSDEFLFCIADVSNHGVGPAMIMSLLSSELKTILRKGLKDPRQICLELNQKFIHETPDHMFITLFLGTYDKTSGRLQLCSSGHNPSFIYRAGNQQVEIIKLKGFPIGVAGSEHYASVLKMKTLELGINDIFFQYTDGLNESMNKKSSQFGMKRIANFLYKNHTLQPDALVQKLARTVEVFSQRKIFCEGPSELHDDIALIAFKREK